MTRVVSPYVEAAWNSFVAEDLRHALVVVPALIVDTGCEDVGVVTEAIEIPMVADVGQVMRGDVEVAVVVVVAAEEVRGVEGSAHGEHTAEDVGMAEGDVEGVIAAEAGADGAEVLSAVALADEGDYLLHAVLLVLHVTGDAPARFDVAVVPALGVDGVYAEELRVALVDLSGDGVDHAAIFKLEETTLGGGEDEGGDAAVSEDEQLHVPAQGR